MKTNRDIERHYFEQFNAAYTLPNGTAEYADRPDVLLRGRRTIGIEMTRFYLQPGGLPRGPEVRNTFIFRYALCGYVSILKRIEDGGAGRTKPEKLRNDVIDVNFAAFATYFDGLLTSDKRAGAIYAEAAALLREVFATPPWWLRGLLSMGGSFQPLPFTR